FKCLIIDNFTLLLYIKPPAYCLSTPASDKIRIEFEGARCQLELPYLIPNQTIIRPNFLI
ncbi:MAG: hypothetical protein QNJ33_04010, partial [Crocosphaera sp.]|nr:hypothetical protein [Crocosphaera sp.]